MRFYKQDSVLTIDQKKIIQMLQEYIPKEKDEIVVKDQILTFIKNNPDCFKRSLKIGHVTASAWLLSCDLEKVLLMHHAKLDMWVQLGGHCDGNSDVLAVAIKEAQEESGIQSISPLSNKIFDIDVHHIPENKKEKGHFHYDIRFLLQVTSDEKIVPNSESKDLRWFSKNLSHLPTNHPSILRMFFKWTKFQHPF